VEEAAAAFRRALQVDPNHAPAHQNLGILALRLGDMRTAQDSLSRALALNPRLPLALNTMGVLYARQGDDARAVDHWRRAVDIDPRQYDALYNIGLVLMRAGNREDARRALERYVRTAPPQRYGAEIANARRALAALR
jgi:tetratricopeptide (TPR) repeat protein